MNFEGRKFITYLVVDIRSVDVEIVVCFVVEDGFSVHVGQVVVEDGFSVHVGQVVVGVVVLEPIGLVGRGLPSRASVCVVKVGACGVTGSIGFWQFPSMGCGVINRPDEKHLLLFPIIICCYFSVNYTKSNTDKILSR